MGPANLMAVSYKNILDKEKPQSNVCLNKKLSFCVCQSDVVHQSVYELVHSEDREELQRQLHWNSFISPDQNLPLQVIKFSPLGNFKLKPTERVHTLWYYCTGVYAARELPSAWECLYGGVAEKTPSCWRVNTLCYRQELLLPEKTLSCWGVNTLCYRQKLLLPEKKLPPYWRVNTLCYVQELLLQENSHLLESYTNTLCYLQELLLPENSHPAGELN